MRDLDSLHSLNKRGDSLPIRKIVYIIIGIVVLLVMTIIFRGSIIPSRDQAAGWFDKWTSSSSSSGEKRDCSKSVEELDNGVEGVIELCDESCSFYINPNELLNYEEFMLSREGYGARKVGLEDFAHMDVFGNDADFSDLHRDAYLELNKVVDGFDGGLSKDEFLDVLDFNPDAHFRILISLSTNVAGAYSIPEIVFSWDGKKWKRTVGEYSRYETDDAVVFNEVYDKYEYGYDVYWDYLGDGTSRVPISGFNVKFMEEDHPRGEFTIWADEKIEFINENPDKVGFYIEIEDPWRNTVYFYEHRQWKRDGIFIDDVMSEGDVLDGILDAYDNGYEIVWHYDGESDIFTLITDEQIFSRRDKDSRDKFKKWFENTKNNFTEDKENQDNLVEDFSWYLREYFVNLNGEELPVKIRRVLDKGNSKILIYFNTTDGDVFGMYSDGEGFVFTHGEGVEKSVVADWVELDDEDWGEFLKINEIYGYLLEKCRI